MLKTGTASALISKQSLHFLNTVWFWNLFSLQEGWVVLGSLYALYCMYVLCLHSVCMCSVCTLYTLCVLRVLCMYAFCVHSVCMHALCVPSVCCITKLYCQLLDLWGGGRLFVPLHKREKGCVCMHVCLCMCVHLCKCLIPVWCYNSSQFFRGLPNL